LKGRIRFATEPWLLLTAADHCRYSLGKEWNEPSRPCADLMDLHDGKRRVDVPGRGAGFLGAGLPRVLSRGKGRGNDPGAACRTEASLACAGSWAGQSDNADCQRKLSRYWLGGLDTSQSPLLQFGRTFCPATGGINSALPSGDNPHVKRYGQHSANGR